MVSLSMLPNPIKLNICLGAVGIQFTMDSLYTTEDEKQFASEFLIALQEYSKASTMVDSIHNEFTPFIYEIVVFMDALTIASFSYLFPFIFRKMECLPLQTIS